MVCFPCGGLTEILLLLLSSLEHMSHFMLLLNLNPHITITSIICKYVVSPLQHPIVSSSRHVTYRGGFAQIFLLHFIILVIIILIKGVGQLLHTYKQFLKRQVE